MLTRYFIIVDGPNGPELVSQGCWSKEQAHQKLADWRALNDTARIRVHRTFHHGHEQGADAINSSGC